RADHALCLARSNLRRHAALRVAGGTAQEELQQSAARAPLRRVGGFALGTSADLWRLDEGSWAKSVSAGQGIFSAAGAACSALDAAGRLAAGSMDAVGGGDAGAVYHRHVGR